MCNMLLILKIVLCALYLLLPDVSAVENPVIVGIYKDWTIHQLAPQEIPFSKITHINYGYVILKDDGTPALETGHVLKQVVEHAHANNVKVLLSFGGWTGSNLFSPMVASPQRRRNFIDKLRDYRDEYKLDGFDIDWEYPGRLRNTCNKFDPKNDADNFLKLLTEMRSSFPKKIITLTVSVHPFDGPNGPMKDVSKFAKHVNFINIQAYDINGGWSETTGPNAPFRWTANKGLPFSFRQSIDAWLKAEFPANKIVMGIPFYGRSMIANVDMTVDPKNMYVAKSSEVPLGDREDAKIFDACASTNVPTGIWKYRNLRSQNILRGG